MPPLLFGHILCIGYKILLQFSWVSGIIYGVKL